MSKKSIWIFLVSISLAVFGIVGWAATLPQNASSDKITKSSLDSVDNSLDAECSRTFTLDWVQSPAYMLTLGEDLVTENESIFPARRIELVAQNESKTGEVLRELPELFSWGCVIQYDAEAGDAGYTWEMYSAHSTPVSLENVPFLDQSIIDVLVEVRLKDGYLGYYYLLDSNGDIYEYYYIGEATWRQQNVKIVLT